MSDVAGKRRTYLIQDPYDADAIDFIRTIDMYFALRPVCFYTDRKARFYGERQFPILTSDVIEAAYDVDDLASFAAEVGDRYEIAAVIPYREDTVELAAELCELLDLGWVAPATLRLFRDKSALKEHIRVADPSVRVPHHRLIHGVDDLLAEPLPDRFVIKPNSGFGNQNVGIFDADQVEAASAHVGAVPSETWILEEYIGGVEYHVNGQVRTGGVVTALSVFEYIRVERNNYPTVYVGEFLCSTSDPVFDPLVEYAARVLAATGLERCPFHMEIKIDDRGPCVIDLGARFASEGGAKNTSRLHPSRPDAFAVAVHDYFGENSVATDPVDWTNYDQQRLLLVYGISDRAELIESISGIDEVEGRTEFVRWLVKPRIGERTQVTRDLRGAPYIVELASACDRDGALALIDEIHRTVSWNDGRERSAALAARWRNVADRASRKVPWLAHRLRGLTVS